MAAVCLFCLALCGAADPAGASPNRVAALGGEARFLIDAVNVHQYPALSVSLGHAGLEPFADWAGVVVPCGGGALGLFANRPSPQLNRFNDWLATAVAPSPVGLDVRPWFEALAARPLGGDRVVGLKVGYAADVEDDGLGETSASLTHVAVGLRLGPPSRRLDLAAHFRRHRLRDRVSTPERRQSDGDLVGMELRGRWSISQAVLAVPVLSIEAGSLGLAPSTRDLRDIRLGLAAHLHPSPGAMALVGILIEYHTDEERLPGGMTLEQWDAALPALVGGAEMRVGSMTFRAGLRHQAVRRQIEALLPDGQISRASHFDAGLQSNLGLGMSFGQLRLDGVLERDFLRDGPHFIGGSRRGGGILADLSLEYMLSP